MKFQSANSTELYGIAARPNGSIDLSGIGLSVDGTTIDYSSLAATRKNDTSIIKTNSQYDSKI